MPFAIRYNSRSTVNGEPVGYVYAQDIGRTSPGCWSGVKDINKATQWADWESAHREIRRSWAEAEVVEVK